MISVENLNIFPPPCILRPRWLDYLELGIGTRVKKIKWKSYQMVKQTTSKMDILWQQRPGYAEHCMGKNAKHAQNKTMLTQDRESLV